MKKQIVGVFVCMIFITSFLPTVSSTDKNDITQPTNKISADDGTDLDECDYCGSDSDNRHTIMKPDLETLQKWMEDYNNAPEAFINPEIELLDNKNLLSHLDYVPSQRNQGSCGNCWAWAGTGVLGIALDVQEGIHDRLSIQYINSCAGSIVRFCCRGGILRYIRDFYNTTGKAIPWSNTNAHWQDGDGSCDIPCENISTTPNYKISSIERMTIETHDVGQSTAISNIKNVLNQNKAVFFGFYMVTIDIIENFFDFWDYSSESAIWNTDFSCGHNYENGGGHAVLCVGYNDDPGTDNDYWIMLNSWGTTNGRPNGLFRLDMNINYDCSYNIWDDYTFYTLQWQTLNVNFGEGNNNNPPNTPITPSGPGACDVDESGTYSTSATDPDADQVQYRFDWDASMSHDYSDWTSLGISGHTGFMDHSWNEPGTYVVKTQAKDIHGVQSSWSGGKTVFVIGGEDNDPPNKPSTPSGPVEGDAGNTYIYTSSTTDSDGDSISYLFNWGDGTDSEWTDPIPSGQTVIETHKWSDQGSYQVKVIARDVPDLDESDWSEPLSVSMPKNKPYINTPFLNFLQNHPILFQLLHHFLKL